MFQVLLTLMPERNTDEELAMLAELGLNALCTEAAGLALGPVASVDLDSKHVEFELTVEAVSPSEVHQKIGLILTALEHGAPITLVETAASRSADPDEERSGELVSA